MVVSTPGKRTLRNSDALAILRASPSDSCSSLTKAKVPDEIAVSARAYIRHTYWEGACAAAVPGTTNPSQIDELRRLNFDR